MSDDLLRQAELRHQRRPKSRQNEEILTLDVTKHKGSMVLIGDKLQVEGSALPPIRHFGTYESRAPGNNVVTNNNELYGGSSALNSTDKPRTPRRRVTSHSGYLEPTSPPDSGRPDVVLPFIKCKLNDREVKILLSTVALRSTISRRCLDTFRKPKNSSACTVVIFDQKYTVHFDIDDTTLHDIILGLDFLTEHKCVIDFNERTFTSGEDGTKTDLLTESDLPLKFRNKYAPASSI